MATGTMIYTTEYYCCVTSPYATYEDFTLVCVKYQLCLCVNLS